MENINNLEYQINQNDLPKEAKDILKMLDTKEGKDEFIKDLFASKEHLTKTFWLPLFEEQFENGKDLMMSLLDFCKNIDINDFNHKPIEFQYNDFFSKLKGHLGEVDLYRENRTYKCIYKLGFKSRKYNKCSRNTFKCIRETNDKKRSTG